MMIVPVLSIASQEEVEVAFPELLKLFKTTHSLQYNIESKTNGM
jgi:hypothetical protein